MLQEKRDALIDAFQSLPDGEERLTYLLSMGRRFPALPDAEKSDDLLLPGCMSRLWLLPEYRDGRCHFRMDADAQIVKGIAAMVCTFYGGETPADIAAQELDFLAEAGVPQLLTPNRRSGLSSLRSRIKAFAVEQLAKDGV
ncbi:cysteine desulfuration protein SufE [Verrucomicrobium sp. GAS474]|uniref:SufE family protein n=1 Tax=Verrucomicrobium sp. GAS474 TaxID=1882831 RepID=UPI00087C8E31|nr:SufE family protein [Verrucomicrobium sp. GAS474]SDT89365.1 cysteine desulfuration protein SufE [Verrucomicrobium sp. GAS474]